MTTAVEIFLTVHFSPIQDGNTFLILLAVDRERMVKTDWGRGRWGSCTLYVSELMRK